MNKNAREFIQVCENRLGKNAVLTRDNIDQIVSETGISYPWWLITKSEYRADRGRYQVPSYGIGSGNTEVNNTSNSSVDNEETIEVEFQHRNFKSTGVAQMNMTVDMAQVMQFRQPKLIDESEPAIPEKYKDYVAFGFFSDLETIIQRNKFYPVFITGLSGNGKTLMVEQVCAKLKRECIRVNISIETDETDLLGGQTLINGSTMFREGPVIQAMRRGAVLLLDEVDRGSNKLMCLQGILEGKPFYNKKTGEVIRPASGFNIIATANTKGRGSEEGKYLSQILDDAFLERFPVTVEQEYPDAKTEKKILKPLTNDLDFIECLVKWADVVRKSYADGATDEVIATRRLVQIVEAYEIFGNRKKAITLCVNRFDEETKAAFLDLYSKVDPNMNGVPKEETSSTPASKEEQFLKEVEF